MPGFIGGSSGSSGTGGEIRFPSEFIDPVTKLRVSQPETMIDTDFEYGLQPTKWETVETINNTPSFFSKSGDTTIPNIVAIVTNAGTREITVTTGTEHGLSVGIPISVTGTKSVTADGTYIINSIPNTTTFTYLCKDNQPTTLSIEDLYSSIITGEFFQGSQIRISDSAGMVTDGASPSTITVTTPSPHGFKTSTPFYFLNLNSTISQEFQAANTETKSFDASNTSTAQTFDGSNTLSSINIDFSNSAVVGGVTSSISSVSAASDTITVAHTTENFFGKTVGTPLYYNVTTSSNYFSTNPRGVVFLKSVGTLGTSTSTFQVSATPDGDVIDITATMTGTFQLANQARVFAGNNVTPATQTTITVVNDAPKTFNGSNTGGQYGTVTGFSGSNVTVASGSGVADLDWYQGRMVYYTTTGSAPSGLSANATYYVDSFFQQGTSINYTFTLKATPAGSVISSISGGTGTHTFTAIGVSLDQDVFHVKNHGYVVNDMLRYDYPVGGRFTVVSSDQIKNFYFVSSVLDTHNFTVNQVIGEVLPLTQSRTGTNAGTAISDVTFTANGFGSGVTWSVISGTLPTGLAINSSTGTISGTPSVAYSQADVTVRAIDSLGTLATATVTFQFNPAPQLYAFTTATFTPGGAGGVAGPNITQARNGVGNPSWAPSYLNMVNSGIQRWTVPATGNFRIRAVGAWGAMCRDVGNDYRGGGASMQGDFALTQGQELDIVVGQGAIQNTGGNYANGGGASGGGSFVWVVNAAQPLVAAGGGGGGSITNGGVYSNHIGRDGVTTTQGGQSAATSYTNYGTNGGDAQYNFSNNPRGWNSMRGGLNFNGRNANSGYGGIGGFGGGGGGGGISPDHAGDGGGGYSAGAAGQYGYSPSGNSDGRNGGGGGGSYNVGSNQVNTGGGAGGNNRGDGFVVITRI